MVAVTLDLPLKLYEILQKDGVLEILSRGKSKKIEHFIKVSEINCNEQIKEQVQQMTTSFLNNQHLLEQNTKILQNIQGLAQLQMAFQAVNLCATVAGFAIMYMKLNKMSSQINEVLSTYKQGQDISSNYEFKKILSTHSDMLDHRKTQRYYTESQMRELVDGEYNVLGMLIEVFNKDVSADKKALIYSIISLSAMLAVSIRYFDEQYYYNTKGLHQGDEIWHTSHDSWMRIYDDLSSTQFIESLQDYAMFDLDLKTMECDVFVIEMVEALKDAKQDICDNQFLLTELDSKEEIKALKDYNNAQIISEIENQIQEHNLDDAATKFLHENMKLVGITL